MEVRRVVLCYVLLCFFFFQAEDGIRDYKVTGVQTCALPIWGAAATRIGQQKSGALPQQEMVSKKKGALPQREPGQYKKPGRCRNEKLADRKSVV